jgi:hypothetical protein
VLLSKEYKERKITMFSALRAQSTYSRFIIGKLSGHHCVLHKHGSATWYTTHVCSTVSTTVVCDPLLLWQH